MPALSEKSWYRCYDVMKVFHGNSVWENILQKTAAMDLDNCRDITLSNKVHTQCQGNDCNIVY